ncbi:hypothetical protein Tco_0743214 [Tanacetum coccineum]
MVAVALYFMYLKLEKPDFQNSHDDEEDPRSSHEYLNDLEEEYQVRALLAKSKRFFLQEGYSKYKPELRPTKDFEVKYNKVKAKLTLISSSASASNAATVKNKVLMALAEENDDVSKEGAKNGEWVKISMRKCICEQISSQKKRILGADQLNEDPSSSRQKDLVFVKSLVDDTKVSIPVAVTNSLATNYDSTNESLVCSTPLPPLRKLDGAEPIFGPGSSHGFRWPSPAKDNKSSSASKVNSAPAGKLKSVKIKDDPPLAICDIKKPIWYLDNKCSRHMTGVKSYLHKYVEQPGPKVVFGDDSTCTTEGYGSIKCNGIMFTKVAFVNGLKYNLIRINQLCDANYIVQFDEKRGTIFNSNKEVVMIAPTVKDVYVLDMTLSAQES